MNENEIRHLTRVAFWRRPVWGWQCCTNALRQEQGLLSCFRTTTKPLVVRKPPSTARAKSVIWLFQTGSPSQVDTFDYKPSLAKRNGEKLAGADPKTGFFTTSGKCLGSPFKFNQHGESGAHISEILPNIARHADDIAFIYSCHSQSNNHTCDAGDELRYDSSGISQHGFMDYLRTR